MEAGLSKADANHKEFELSFTFTLYFEMSTQLSLFYIQHLPTQSHFDFSYLTVASAMYQKHIFFLFNLHLKKIMKEPRSWWEDWNSFIRKWGGVNYEVCKEVVQHGELAIMFSQPVSSFTE